MPTNKFVLNAMPALAGAAISCMLAVAVPPASAHSAATYVPTRWADNNGNQLWHFASNFPTGAYRSRISDGVATWNALDQRIIFSGPQADVADFDPSVNTCSSVDNNVLWRSIDGALGTLALTYRCSDGSGHWAHANMVIDNAENWYSGTGTPASNAVDLWGVATHEWGHAVGMEHLNDSTACPDGDTGPNNATMCPIYAPGVTYNRTLETHDIHTFEPAYGPTWYLSNSNTSPSSASTFAYGSDGDQVLACDWDGNGTTTIAIHRGNTFYIRNSNTSGTADLTVIFGLATDIPLCGDWNGDGVDTIGVYRNGEWLLNDQNDGSAPDYDFTYGNSSGDTPLVGNWDGSSGANADTIGVVRTGNDYFLRNSNSSGAASLTFSYGNTTGDQPVTGDWDGNGTTTIGVFRSGDWYLNNANDNSASEYIYGYGNALDKPIPGNWDGSATNHTTTAGVVRGDD